MMSLPTYLPWEILASMVFAESLVITHLVPLVTLGESNERKMIIGALSFNESKCKGNPDTSQELKNSTGKCTAWDSPSTESSDLYLTGSPGNCATKAVLIVQVISLSVARCTAQKAKPYS